MGIGDIGVSAVNKVECNNQYKKETYRERMLDLKVGMLRSIRKCGVLENNAGVKMEMCDSIQHLKKYMEH